MKLELNQERCMVLSGAFTSRSLSFAQEGPVKVWRCSADATDSWVIASKLFSHFSSFISATDPSVSSVDMKGGTAGSPTPNLPSQLPQKRKRSSTKWKLVHHFRVAFEVKGFEWKRQGSGHSFAVDVHPGYLSGYLFWIPVPANNSSHHTPSFLSKNETKFVP